MKKIFISLGTFWAFPAIAQNNIDLNPVSVTATRFAQKTEETGRNITVIEGKMFQELPVQSLDELLRFVPGVEVQARGPMGAQSDIVLRGGTYQQVLVLIDGLKLNDPTTGHFNSYIPVAPYEIERIEILRGPAAATYGAEAVGGVINIITKSFSGKKQEHGTQGMLNFTNGEYNFWNVDAGAQINGKVASGTIGRLINNTDGQLLRGDNRGYIRNNTLSGSVNFHLAPGWSLGLRSSYDYREFAAQNFYTTFASDTATEKVRSYWNQLQLKNNFRNGTQQLDMVYKQSADEYQYNPLSTANKNIGEWTMAQYIQNRYLSPVFNISFGAQASLRAIRSNDRGDHQTKQSALFATLLYQYKNWHVSGSARGDWDENFGFAFLPQANISYVWDRLTFRASAGRAIRSADFTERFNNYNKSSVAGGSIGNPNLTAEQSWSYEAGISARINNELKINSSFFYRNQNDVIDWVNTPYAEMPRQENLLPGGSYALARNIKTVNTRGFEIDFSYQKAFGAKHHIYANIGATLLKSESNDSIPSFYIIAHAKTLIQGTVIYRYSKWSLALTCIYKERNPQTAAGINAEISNAYWVMNTKIGYRFTPKWNAFVAVNNIGDVQYSDLLGSKMPDRWLMAGAGFHF